MKGICTVKANVRFVVDSLAVMVCLGSNGTAPSVNIKVDNERVAIQPPGRYEFSFRRPAAVFIECFLPCGKTQERTKHTLQEMVVVLTDDGMLGILTDKGEMTICSGMPGVLVESEEPETEAEVVEA